MALATAKQYFCVASFLLLVLSSVTGLAVTTEQSRVVLPGSSGNTQAILFLSCSIDPAPESIFAPLHWVLPSAQTVDIFNSDERITVFANPQFEAGSVTVLRLDLFVEQLSYVDAGTYVCEAEENGETVSASVDVELEVDLQVVGNLSSITLYNDTAEIALSCEMSLYLRPDEDLQWFENGELINATTEMENYTISYSYGSESGQFGGAGVGLSRVSTLVISQPSDSATYTCAIRNTQLSHDINITVKTEGQDSTSPEQEFPTPAAPPTTTIQVAEVGTPRSRPGTLSSSRQLGCYIAPLTPTFEVEWILPDRTIVTSSGGRFIVNIFKSASGRNILLSISTVSYADGGKYVCRFKDTSDASSKWISNSTQLQFPVLLEVQTPSQRNVTVFDNATEVALSCEMSLYLRPDEDLQWFWGEQQIASDAAKHTITYTNGSGQGQFGENAIGPSRVSTLVISQPQMSDSATYTCAIRNTDQSHEIELTVEKTDEGLAEDPTTSDLVTVVIYTSSGAALVILVVLMTVMVFCIATMLRVRKRAGKSEQVPEDHFYDFIPGESSNFTAIDLGSNPAYDTAPQDQEESTLTTFKAIVPELQNSQTTNGKNQITADYYMNEGMDPEKLYTSLPDYTRMAASYPAHTLHADTTSDNQYIPISDQTAGHEYDTVPGDRKDHTLDDEYVHIPDTETQPPHREDNTAPTGD